MEIVFWLAVAAWVHGLCTIAVAYYIDRDIYTDAKGVGTYGLAEMSTAICVIVVFYFAGALN